MDLSDHSSNSDHPCYTAVDAIRRNDRQREWSDRVAEYFVELKEQQQHRLVGEQESGENDGEEDDTTALTLVRKRKAKGSGGSRSRHKKTLSNGAFDFYEDCMVNRYRRTRIGKDFHGFMHLPVALRYMVYEHALVRGKIFVSNTFLGPGRLETGQAKYSMNDYYGKRRQRYLDVDLYRSSGVTALAGLQGTAPINPVETGLLRGVCKAVQTEAEYVFWGSGNTFVFPAGEFHDPLVFYYDGLRRPRNDMKPAKSVSYTFDWRDAGYLDPYLLRKDAADEYGGDRPFEELDALLQQVALHDIQRGALEQTWYRRCRVINSLPLRKLQIDIGECYCPMGCCRLVEFVFGRLCENKKAGPVNVEVLGWKNKDEKDEILALIASGRRTNLTVAFVKKMVEVEPAGGKVADT